MKYCWVILEMDKFCTNMFDTKFIAMKGIDKSGDLKILRFSDEETAYVSLTSEHGDAFKAKNKHKDCSYTIIKIYE